MVYRDVTEHYDFLIDENNDPVYDPEELKAYMDRYDGQNFIDVMKLTATKSVLEIGVGTGRLALRVIPHCKQFCGIDISPKTIQRAAKNLSRFRSVTLICNDFLMYDFSKEKFDVIYSSLTFMHISDKHDAIRKVHDLLSDDGIFLLSIDKSQSDVIDMGSYQVKIYPDTPDMIGFCCDKAAMRIVKQYETEFSHILVIRKDIT